MSDAVPTATTTTTTTTPTTIRPAPAPGGRRARLPRLLSEPMWVLGLVVLVDEIDTYVLARSQHATTGTICIRRCCPRVRLGGDRDLSQAGWRSTEAVKQEPRSRPPTVAQPVGAPADAPPPSARGRVLVGHPGPACAGASLGLQGDPAAVSVSRTRSSSSDAGPAVADQPGGGARGWRGHRRPRWSAHAGEVPQGDGPRAGARSSTPCPATPCRRDPTPGERPPISRRHRRRDRSLG